MKIELLYGSGKLSLQLPEEARAELIKPRKNAGLPDPKGALRKALQQPVNSRPLAARAKPGRRIGIIFNDITRATPNDLIIGAILEEIPHIPRENITLYNALGTHRPNTEEELKSILSPNLAANFRIVQNNAFDKETQVCLGETKRGYPIWLNKDLLENDLIILTGFIEPHFFAGFSGGCKAVMPGMAGLRTIMHNHDVVNIGSPYAIWGEMDRNPVQQEVREIVSPLKNTFLVNVAMNDDQEITAVFAGDVLPAHDQGCAFVRENAMAAVEEPFDIIITSNSGYPLDQNLYQSVKGMSAAAQILQPGGAIIMAAECRDGIPDHGLFGKMLLEAESSAQLLEMISQPGFHQLDQWQIQVLAMLQQKAKIYVYSDYFDRETVESRLLLYTEDIGRTVAELLETYGRDARIGVLPEGPLTMPYVKVRVGL
jgi:nickel-dependent lactate racemase